MSKNNTAHEFVIKCIEEALFKLMETKKISDITISELCQKAGVSRISFYRNYNYITDILINYFSDYLEIWWQDVSVNNNIYRIDDFWEVLFNHLRKKEKEIKLLYRSGASHILKDIIFKSCGPQITHNDKEAYSRAILAGLIYGYTDEWIRRGMKEYPEYISINTLITNLSNFQIIGQN